MMSAAEAAAMMGGRLIGADVALGGVSTDTRTLGRGSLFVALRGERFDGHAFLDEAQRRGAAAVVVEQAAARAVAMPLIAVDDTTRALGRLGRAWRERFSPVLFAIAGSNGKTTVKEMLASILRRHAGEAQTLATEGNLNNAIGVPLTLLRLRAAHRYCAVELGMNRKGEIAYLADLARPTVALVNNAQREHLEFMGSVEEVAAENAEVYRALPPEGIAVVNADDAMAGLLRERAGGRRRIEFGLGGGDVAGRYALKGLQSEIVVRTPAGEAPAALAIPGVHNVRNALAAAACAHAAGVPPAAIGAGLSAFRPYSGRLQVRRTAAGATLIDDSYNANPDSARASIDVLAACEGPTALVLGDMGEVGERGPEFHAEVGRYAKQKGIGSLFTFGNSSRESSQAFGSGGVHFEAIEDLVGKAAAAKTILVKGSRFMRMERIVAALAGAPGAEH